MSNEVIVKKSNVSTERSNIIVPDFKDNRVNLGDEPRKLQIKVENGTRSDGTKFKKVTGYVKLPIYEGIGEEAKYVRDGVKRISVHFRQDAFDDRPETSNISKINDLKSKISFISFFKISCLALSKSSTARSIGFLKLLLTKAAKNWT